jgi:hypothetical protein
VASVVASSATVASVAASTASSSSVQRFRLRDGLTAVVDQEDHVTLLSDDGLVKGESWCGANGISYRKAVDFLTEVVRLVKASDKNALADLVNFPLRVPPKVYSRAEFLARYDRIFTLSEVTAISDADPGDVFCKNGAFMLGLGLIWVMPDEKGAYKVVTVNRPFRKPSR